MSTNRTIMKSFLAVIASLLILGAETNADAQPFAYIPNGTDVSVIDTGTNTVVATVVVGSSAQGVAVNRSEERRVGKECCR